MSATIQGTTISLTRGDTLQVSLTITDANGDPYTPTEGDVIRFAVKKFYTDEAPVIVKTINPEALVLYLLPADTAELEFGTYVYDIQITMAGGIVDTVIPRASFKLLEEVE